MKAVRAVVFWCHLIVGVLVAAVVVVMSATGVLLTYQKQIQSWADTRGLAGGPTIANASRSSLDSVIARVAASTGTAPTAVTIRTARDAPLEVTLGRERRVFVDAYTGRVLGEGSPRTRNFFRTVTAWHRTLGAAGENRALGRAITGFANAGFLFILLSGLFLWWPRTWTRTRLRNVALFRRRMSGKARNFNWHNTIGVWSFLPLVAIAGSGVVMSYPWANALVYRVMGEQPPQQQQAPAASTAAPGGTRAPKEASSAPMSATLPLDAAVAAGIERMPDWRAISIQLPSPSAQTLTVSLDAGAGGQPQRRGSLVINRANATPVRWEPFSAQTPGRRLRSMLRFAHTGELLGPVGQTIAGVVSLGAVVLAWTGVALALRRLITRRRRSTRVAANTRPVPTSELDTAA